MKTEDKGYALLTYMARCKNALEAILFPDSMILNEVGNPTIDKRVNLHYWNSKIEIGDNCPYNLGDNLSEIIVTWMLEKKGLSLNTKVRAKKHLYAVGSILSMGYQNATIWGAGFLEPLSNVRRFFHSSKCRKLDIRAVRGPVTRELLLSIGHKCPEIYGDPALLLPLIYNPEEIEEHRDFLIIPHFSKEEEYVKKYGRSAIGTMKTNDYEMIIKQIKSSKKVISGSLHGIILSESYGVPAIFLRDRAAYKDFKYEDYYQSTGRRQFSFASSIEQAIEMDPMPLPKNIKELQECLLDSFPYDLWLDNM